MVNSPSGFNTLDQQSPQNNSSERKVYIDRKTGNIVDANINSAELANYIEATPSTKIYIDINREFSDWNNAISTAETWNTVWISVAQYEQYKKNSKEFLSVYNDPTTTKDYKSKVMKLAMNKIVDSNIDFPVYSKNYDIKLLQMLAFIVNIWKEALYTPNSPETQKPVDDKQAQLDALMNQLNENSWEKSSTSELSEQNNNAVKWFFKTKVTKKDTWLFWRPRLLGNTTQIINDTEYQWPTMMLSGNGFSFRWARTNVLVNKMITKLEWNDPDIVIAEIFGFTKRSFGTGRRLVHKTKLFHNLKDPIKFDEKFQKRLAEYRQYRLRNLDPNEQEAIIQAINNAKNAYVQQHINQAQSIIR